MITLVSYASPTFEKAALFQRLSFLKYGGERIISFSKSSLSSSFYTQNIETLSHSRGAGYWLWKPRIILDSLNIMRDSDMLLYLDAGISFKKSLFRIEEILDKRLITIWKGSDSSLLEQWTHPYVAEHFSLSPDQLTRDLLMAGAIAVPRTPENIFLITKWLDFCEDPKLLRPETVFHNIERRTGNFIWHRHDSTLLSILAIQNESGFSARSFQEFKSLFDLHRNPKPRYFLILFRPNWLSKFREILKGYMPKLFVRTLILLKFNLVANRKGLSRDERLRHIKFFKD